MAAAGRENLLNSVPAPCTVLIAAPDLLATLERRAAPEDGELITFTDADALRASTDPYIKEFLS